MIINFPVTTIWGRVTFKKTIPDQTLSRYIDGGNNIFAVDNTPGDRVIKNVRDVLNCPGETVVVTSDLADEDWLINKKVTKSQAKSCLLFFITINSIPLIRDGDGSISRNSRNSRGIFFPFTESEFGSVEFSPLSWAATQASFDKQIEYLCEQGYLELGGNYGIEKVNYPVLTGV